LHAGEFAERNLFGAVVEEDEISVSPGY